MLKFLSKLFRKTPSTPVPSVVVPPQRSSFSRPAAEVAAVETAQLSLAVILAKLPEDLKDTVAKMPAPEVTVTLPVPTILKQLPTGSVKISLASLHRQAPAGVFKPVKTDEKRMVDVPLGEIFKRVRPELIRRRDDQRRYDMPEEGYNLFGDKNNPYAIAPTAPTEPPKKAEPPVEAKPAARMPKLVPMAPAPNVPKPKGGKGKIKPPQEVAATVAPKPVAKPAPAPAEPSDQPPLSLSIKDLADGWPDQIKTEVSAMNGATVTLPTGDVTAGLARGKVSFTWGQLRSWSTPPPTDPTNAPEETELSLPLRVVAPAFLKQSKKDTPKRKSIAIDEEIPALFQGGENVPKPAPTPVPAAAEPLETPAAEAAPAPKAVAPVEVAPVAETPTVVAPAEPSPAPVPETLGQAFGNPEKTDWSPGEIVSNLMKLPGIAGAVVALQEGLVVAHELPEGIKGDTFAAFLPQIFARINQYSGEMALGEVDDLVLTTHGAHCQMFRVGQVFFAVLGKPDGVLPWHTLRLCANQLAK